MSYRQKKATGRRSREKQIEKARKRLEKKKLAEQRKKEEEKQEREQERKDVLEKARGQISNLCQVDEQGNLLRTLVTSENLKKIQETVRELGIKETQMGRQLTQAEYCKLFKGYVFKAEKCDDKVCCQAITEEGTRCKRPASEYFTVDLTERSIVPKIPDVVEKSLGKKKTEELKLIGFANSCCFYCWQHALMYGARALTWVDNISYYATHPEDLLGIFFEEVEPSKFMGILPMLWRYRVSGLRSPDEIIKHGFKVAAAMAGVFTRFYWGVLAMVFFYDMIRPVLLRVMVNEDKVDLIDEMAVSAAKTLLRFNEIDVKDVPKSVEAEIEKVYREEYTTDDIVNGNGGGLIPSLF